jgi:hypothetical protein
MNLGLLYHGVLRTEDVDLWRCIVLMSNHGHLL